MEKTIVAAIKRYLKTTDLVWWRQQVGLLQFGPRKVYVGKPGLPDFFIVRPGGLIMGLEVKTKVGRQSDVQKAFQGELQASGGVYKVVRSLQEAKEAIGWKQQ